MLLSTKTIYAGLLASLFFMQSANANTITINSGSTLLVSGGDLTLNCTDFKVIVNSGGTLTVTGGTVRNIDLQILPGGQYQNTGGNVTDCGSFYIIKTAKGTAIISL